MCRPLIISLIASLICTGLPVLASPPQSPLSRLAAKLADHVNCTDANWPAGFVRQTLSPGELAFLQRDRRTIIETLLKSPASRSSAALFGYLGVRRALPIIRRWFVNARWFYGWESSRPRVFAPEQYPDHYCYERAMRHLGGRKLRLKLTTGEVNQLRADYKRKRSRAVLYLLYRFARKEARSLVFNEMRRGTNRARACEVLRYFKLKGLSRLESLRSLGRPDKRLPNSWHYRCDRSGFELQLGFSTLSARTLTLVGWHGTSTKTVHNLR